MLQNDLRLTLIQTDIYWHDITANLAHYEEWLWDLKGATDVIILPEMFQTGFTMEVEAMAEPINFTTFKWMRRLAEHTQALVLGSHIVKDRGQFFNRLLWVEPDGAYATYDKRHLFRMANEHHHFSSGKTRLVRSWKGWRIHPLVCYDLRFPVWSRNRSIGTDQPEYDLLLYVANWPAARVNAWDALLQARAIENLCFVAGVNRVGEDGKQIPYNGHSSVYSPRVERLWYGGEEVSLGQVTLSADNLNRFREKFPAHLDADQFEINLEP
ncbi:MAG TPA: amidohydrolase [Cytophagales bacterium]|nr:amidohydrolase [Cytophagales bacterium]HAA20251.1 amidohydrolase [Cytophagales bacterium]HAP61785.1 amidohydrolase [Cytophagales bacterium]